MQGHHETHAGTMHRDGGVFVAAFPGPSAETARWCAGDGILGVDLDFGVFLGGHLTDENVVFTGGHAVMRSKAFVAEEQPLAVGEVLPDTHVWLPCQSRREILESDLQSIEANQSVEQSSRVVITAVADDHLGVVVVTADHAA